MGLLEIISFCHLLGHVPYLFEYWMFFLAPYMKYILQIGILVPTEPIYQIHFISDFDPPPSGIETFATYWNYQPIK